MKKLLTILSSFGLIATTGASVVACKNDQSNSLQPKETGNEELGNTGLNKEAEVKKLKSQIAVLDEAIKKAEGILKQIEEGKKKAATGTEEEKKKIKEQLEVLNRKEAEVKKQLETAKITKEDLEAKLKLLENNNS